MRWRSVVIVALGLLAAAVQPAAADTWTSSGPGPSQVTSVAFDPTQQGVAYAGTPGGAVFRSADGGGTWARVGSTGDDRIVGISARGSRVVVSWTGGVFTGVGGIRRSFDGGATWEVASTAQGIANTDVGPVAIDPATPDTVLLGTNAGVFRSTNAGASWSPVAIPTGTQIASILFDPAAPGRVFAASNSGISISTDHGASFSPYNTAPGNLADATLALAGGTLYAGGSSAVVRTPTGGAAAWADASNGLGMSSYFISSLVATGIRMLAVKDGNLVSALQSGPFWSGLIGPGMPIFRLAADPFQTTRVLAAGDGLARSLDSGQTWDRVDGGISGLAVQFVAGASARAVLLGTSTGVMRSDDLGATFTRSSAGLTGGLYGSPVIDPGNPSRVFVHTSDGLFASTDAGRSWAPRDYGPPNADGLIAVAPSDATRLYSAGFSGAIGLARRSFDSGATWGDANSNGPGGAMFTFARGLAVDAADARIAYLSTTDGMRVTTDGGDHWVTGGGLPAGSTGVVRADPVAPDVAYVIAADKIWRTADHGGSWTPATVLPGGVPGDLLVDPKNPATLYVATDVGVFRSPDRGATWTAFSDGLPNRHVHALSIDPDHAALYAATDSGLGVASLVPPAGAPPSAAIPVPVGKPAARPFKATSAFRFPSNRACLKRPPRLRLTYLKPKGVTVEAFEARIGRKRLVKRTGAKARRSITLARLPSKAFTLSIRVTPRGGPTVSAKKAYRVCAKRKPRKRR